MNSVATVLTVYGIETRQPIYICKEDDYAVATVLTVYGIETSCYGYDYRYP